MVEYLRDEIIRGIWQPGQKLRQEELASRFEVSAIPVREALRELQAEGLVTSQPHRGAVVTQLSAEALEDIYDIRINLESMAIALAVPKMTAKTLERLSACVKQMDNPDHDATSLAKLNHQFHLSIYQASERKYLCELIEIQRRRTQHYVRAHISAMNAMPQSQAQHQAILKACQEGNAEKAAKKMQEHLTRVKLELINYVQEKELVN